MRVQKVDDLIVAAHYNRNVCNTEYTLEELDKMNVDPVEDEDAKFHQNNTINDTPNEKYVVGDWFSSEVVYYSDGTVNDTPEDMGTFNVYSGNNEFLNVIVHGPFDVIPYMIWGNSPDDSTTIIDRIAMIWRN